MKHFFKGDLVRIINTTSDSLNLVGTVFDVFPNTEKPIQLDIEDVGLARFSNEDLKAIPVLTKSDKVQVVDTNSIYLNDIGYIASLDGKRFFVVFDNGSSRLAFNRHQIKLVEKFLDIGDRILITQVKSDYHNEHGFVHKVLENEAVIDFLDNNGILIERETFDFSDFSISPVEIIPLDTVFVCNLYDEFYNKTGFVYSIHQDKEHPYEIQFDNGHKRFYQRHELKIVQILEIGDVCGNNTEDFKEKIGVVSFCRGSSVYLAFEENGKGRWFHNTEVNKILSDKMITKDVAKIKEKILLEMSLQKNQNVSYTKEGDEVIIINANSDFFDKKGKILAINYNNEFPYCIFFGKNQQKEDVTVVYKYDDFEVIKPTVVKEDTGKKPTAPQRKPARKKRKVKEQFPFILVKHKTSFILGPLGSLIISFTPTVEGTANGKLRIGFEQQSMEINIHRKLDNLKLPSEIIEIYSSMLKDGQTCTLSLG